MTDSGDSPDIFDDESRKPLETPDEAVKRLRADVAAGEEHLRPELAEALMRRAQEATHVARYEDAIGLVDEAIKLVEELIEDGEVEYINAVGRCMLFRSAITRIAKGPEAALLAFNETIRYFSERVDTHDPGTQNELALALLNKADLLTEPFGAVSAAIAAQEQAIRIWQRLLDKGGMEFRGQLVATLLLCGDSKFQSGDPEKALADYRQAMELAHEAIDDDEREYRLFLIQILVKMTRLFEQTGRIPQAFDTSAEAIELVETIVAEGDADAENMLTALCMQHGSLYERLNDSAAALAQYDRCREIYQRLVEGDDLELPGSYIVRTGYANVMMCRGNMLAEQKRFEEASEAFEEAVRLYREAGALQSADDANYDDTFIPYSVGVVRLNQANMLSNQGLFTEAMTLKEEALAALRQRLEAGHGEILPNLIAGYKKMVGICRVQNDLEKATFWINELVRMIDHAVDEGQLQYRSDLAMAYHLRSIDEVERENFADAEKDVFRALRLFRDMADECCDVQEEQVAKIQWSELLERLAMLYVRQQRVDDAIALFQRAVDDAMIPFAEGNPPMIFDMLLAYTRMMNFVETLLHEKGDEFSDDDKRRWIHQTLDAAASGVELCQGQHIHFGDQTLTKLFFTMKIAFFLQVRGTLFMALAEYAQAEKEYGLASEQWEQIVHEMDKLRQRRLYFEADPAAKPADEIDLFTEDTWQDRFLYYIGEYRLTMQRRGQCALEQGNYPQAEVFFQRDVELARDLVRRGIHDADRFLVLSLVHVARYVEDVAPFATTHSLYAEARELLRKRFYADDQEKGTNGSTLQGDDYSMFRNLHVSFALFLLKNEQVDQAGELMDRYAADLETVQVFPSPAIWCELCRGFDVFALCRETEPLSTVRETQHRFLARHPEFETNEELQTLDKELSETNA